MKCREMLLYCLVAALLPFWSGCSKGCSSENKAEDVLYESRSGFHAADSPNSKVRHPSAASKQPRPPQPAPKTAGRTNTVLPMDCPLTFKTLGAEIRIYYTQISASLIKDEYHFCVEAKTRGRIKGEKSTFQIPPYMRINWKTARQNIERTADLKGMTFSAGCVLLLKRGQWASGSSMALRITRVDDTAVYGKFDGTFRFVSGPLQGRTFKVSEGSFRAHFSRAIPQSLR